MASILQQLQGGCIRRRRSRKLEDINWWHGRANRMNRGMRKSRREGNQGSIRNGEIENCVIANSEPAVVTMSYRVRARNAICLIYCQRSGKLEGLEKQP
jgi:hypothetical protein